MTVKNRCVVSRVRRKTKNIYYVDRLAVYKQNKPNSLMHQQPREKKKTYGCPFSWAEATSRASDRLIR